MGDDLGPLASGVGRNCLEPGHLDGLPFELELFRTDKFNRLVVLLGPESVLPKTVGAFLGVIYKKHWTNLLECTSSAKGLLPRAQWIVQLPDVEITGPVDFRFQDDERSFAFEAAIDFDLDPLDMKHRGTIHPKVERGRKLAPSDGQVKTVDAHEMFNQTCVVR